MPPPIPSSYPPKITICLCYLVSSGFTFPALARIYLSLLHSMCAQSVPMYPYTPARRILLSGVTLVSLLKLSCHG